MLLCLSEKLCCAVVVADSLIGIFYGDFCELTLLESQRASIESTAACMQKNCPWSFCLPTKSDLLLSYAARLKLSYPATPSSVPPSALTSNIPTYTHTHTYRHNTPTRWSLRLSFGRSSLVYFSPESVQNFPDCGVFM